MLHEATRTHDQVPPGRCPGGAAAGPGRPAGVLRRAEPEGLHPAPTVPRPGPQDVPQDRLSGRRPVPHRLRRDPHRPRAGQGPALLDAVLRGRPAAKKGEVVCLLVSATVSAADRGLIGETPTAAVDGTGLES